MADQYKDLSHSAAEVDQTIERFASHTADTVSHVTILDRENWDAKQDALTFDDIPTADSSKPVKSGGVFSALAGKQDKTAQNFEDGANLDTFTESGTFKSIDSTKTATLYNCPVSGFGFIMIVHKLSSAASTQIIYCAGASSAKIFVRQKKSTGWNPWYLFESSTVAPPINVPTGALNLSPQTEDM